MAVRAFAIDIQVSAVSYRLRNEDLSSSQTMTSSREAHRASMKAYPPCSNRDDLYQAADSTALAC
jgi:hypothetical protein